MKILLGLFSFIIEAKLDRGKLHCFIIFWYIYNHKKISDSQKLHLTEKNDEIKGQSKKMVAQFGS